MKFDITCCFLAFYAFEIIHAYMEDDLAYLRAGSIEELKEYAKPRMAKAQRILRAAKSVQKRHACRDDYKHSLQILDIRTRSAFDKCLDDGRRAYNFLPAQSCAWEAVRSINIAMDTIVAQTKKCTRKKNQGSHYF